MGLPSSKSSFTKGNWTFKMDHGGPIEKHEKGKHGTYLGNFYLVAQLITRNSNPGNVDMCCIMYADLECQSEGLGYYSFLLLAKFPVLQTRLRKGKCFVQGHRTGPSELRPALISFGPQTNDPSVHHIAPSTVVECSYMIVTSEGQVSKKLQKLL